MKKVLGTIALLFVLISTYGQNNQAVSFTLQDRDRIMRTEEKTKSLQNEIKSLRNEMITHFEALESKTDTRFEALDTHFEAMDTRFDSQQRQINDIKILFYWGFGIMISLMIFMMGYMIWDRRTALNPVKEKVEENERFKENLTNALIEYSRKDPSLAEILRSFGIF